MFKILTVAETDYDSDKIAFEHVDWWHGGYLRIEVSVDKKIAFKNANTKIEILDFKRSDLRSLILALQEAETFLSEAELVEKLIGK